LPLTCQADSPQEILRIVGIFPFGAEDNRIGDVGINEDSARHLGDI
jgi:hypothetical protein